MNAEAAVVIRLAIIGIPLLLFVGLYCVIVSRNLIRVMIGLELLTKAVTLLLIVAGYVTGNMALAQSLVITLIIVEVVVIAIAAGLIINVFNLNDSLSTDHVSKLKG